MHKVKDERISSLLLGTTLYLGIDPGASGGFAVVGWQGNHCNLGKAPLLLKMPKDEQGVWDWLGGMWRAPRWVRMVACIEQIDPRPAVWLDKMSGEMRSSIIRSTCILYGHYKMLTAMLTACDLRYLSVPPRSWQAYFGLKKEKNEKPSHWKNRLKDEAQRLYPQARITLATADAVLLARYCQDKHSSQRNHSHATRKAQEPSILF